MYDISDDRRLRLVHDVVRSHGSRFQYSVYLCDLSPRELVALRWQVGEVMDHLKHPGSRDWSGYWVIGSGAGWS